MSQQQQQISFFSAILININIMVGIGIFINTVILAQRTGILGCFSYGIVGLLMFPLVLSFAHLLVLHPRGSIYTFGQKELGSFAGFISAWSYFTGKLGSATLMIHASVLLIQHLFPQHAPQHPLLLDSIIIIIFVLFNLLNMRTGTFIQYCFVIFKFIPILTIILGGIFFFSTAHIQHSTLIWSGIPSTLPLVLYAALGFEAASSISSKIQHAQRNAPRVVIISYVLAMSIAVFYQFMFYGALGDQLRVLTDFRQAFPILAAYTGNIYLSYCIPLMHAGIVVSALGGAYSVLFSNNWNLYTLAQHGHIFFSKQLSVLNRYYIPWICIIFEGIICLAYLLVTQGHQSSLQYISSFGCTIAYAISVIALLHAKYHQPHLTVSWVIPILGLCSCGILVVTTILQLIQEGMLALIAFSSLLLCGSYMFFKQKK